MAPEEVAWEQLQAAIVRRFNNPGLAADLEVATLRDALIRAMGDDPDRSNVVQFPQARPRAA